MASTEWTELGEEIFPNPASDVVHLQIRAELTIDLQVIVMYDVMGKQYTPKWTVSREFVTIDTRTLKNGIYTIRAMSRGHQWEGKVLLKK